MTLLTLVDPTTGQKTIERRASELEIRSASARAFWVFSSPVEAPKRYAFEALKFRLPLAVTGLLANTQSFARRGKSRAMLTLACKHVG
jgi:hypothetical protein